MDFDKCHGHNFIKMWLDLTAGVSKNSLEYPLVGQCYLIKSCETEKRACCAEDWDDNLGAGSEFQTQECVTNTRQLQAV